MWNLKTGRVDVIVCPFRTSSRYILGLRFLCLRIIFLSYWCRYRCQTWKFAMGDVQDIGLKVVIALQDLVPAHALHLTWRSKRGDVGISASRDCRSQGIPDLGTGLSTVRISTVVIKMNVSSYLAGCESKVAVFPSMRRWLCARWTARSHGH